MRPATTLARIAPALILAACTRTAPRAPSVPRAEPATPRAPAPPPGVRRTAESPAQPLAAGVTYRTLQCEIVRDEPTALPTGRAQIAVHLREVARARSSLARLSLAENPQALRVRGEECVQRYPSGRVADFFALPAWRDRVVLAATNASLFHHNTARPAPPGAPARFWEADGLVWSATGTLDRADGISAPLQFNECRTEPTPVVVIDRAGLHEVRVDLVPCPAGLDAGATPVTDAAPLGAGSSGSMPWCGGASEVSRWAREHREACVTIPASQRAATPALGASGAVLTTRELVAGLRRAFPDATAIAQFTGPWPPFSSGRYDAASGNLVADDGSAHPLRCRDRRVIARAGMAEPVITGIEHAICDAKPRTVLCGRSDGSVSLITTVEPIGLYDLAIALRRGSGCGVDCDAVYNFDGGGSTQMGVARAGAPTDGAPAVDEYGFELRPPHDGERACGPYRAPVNFFVLHQGT